jgi:hypothetical protein
VGKYGLQMLVTSDAGLQKYLQQVLTQLSEWLYAGSVQKLVLVITSLETQTVRFAQERAGDAGVLCGALALTRLVRGHVCVLCVCVFVCVCVCTPHSALGCRFWSAGTLTLRPTAAAYRNLTWSTKSLKRCGWQNAAFRLPVTRERARERVSMMSEIQALRHSPSHTHAGHHE